MANPRFVFGGLSCALERACLCWFVDFDLHLAPQHLRNGGLEPRVRPRDVSGHKTARTRQGDGVEAARSNAHCLWLVLSVPVAYQQALLNSSAFTYFPNRRTFEFELRGGAGDPLARHCLISWVPSDQNRQFYSRNRNPVDVRKSRYPQHQHGKREAHCRGASSACCVPMHQLPAAMDGRAEHLGLREILITWEPAHSK
jgi:hypothetical protein